MALYLVERLEEEGDGTKRTPKEKSEKKAVRAKKSKIDKKGH